MDFLINDFFPCDYTVYTVYESCWVNVIYHSYQEINSFYFQFGELEPNGIETFG